MLTFYISMLETEEQQDKFSYIYQNYVGFMYHVAKEVVKEHYLAEDVVHETFLQLIRIIDKVHIDDELTLRAFLRRVTHNKAVDCVRKWDKVRPTEDDELERYDTKHKQDPETIAIDALAFNELIAMISKMDDRYERLNETLSLVPTTRDVFAKRQAIEFTLWLLACLGALGLSVRVLKQR